MSYLRDTKLKYPSAILIPAIAGVSISFLSFAFFQSIKVLSAKGSGYPTDNIYLILFGALFLAAIIEELLYRLPLQPRLKSFKLILVSCLLIQFLILYVKISLFFAFVFIVIVLGLIYRFKLNESAIRIVYAYSSSISFGIIHIDFSSNDFLSILISLLYYFSFGLFFSWIVINFSIGKSILCHIFVNGLLVTLAIYPHVSPSKIPKRLSSAGSLQIEISENPIFGSNTSRYFHTENGVVFENSTTLEIVKYTGAVFNTKRDVEYLTFPSARYNIKITKDPKKSKLNGIEIYEALQKADLIFLNPKIY